jgi:hypothetical protein
VAGAWAMVEAMAGAPPPSARTHARVVRARDAMWRARPADAHVSSSTRASWFVHISLSPQGARALISNLILIGSGVGRYQYRILEQSDVAKHPSPPQ